VTWGSLMEAWHFYTWQVQRCASRMGRANKCLRVPTQKCVAKYAWMHEQVKAQTVCTCRIGQTIYIRCIYGIFGSGISKYTVNYGAYIRFWSTLLLWQELDNMITMNNLFDQE